MCPCSGFVSKISCEICATVWGLRWCNFIPKEVKYHKAGPIFGAAVREGFAVRYDTAAPFLGPPGGPSFGSVFVAQLLNAALDAAPQSRPPLLMNRDETAILRHVSGLRGTATSKMQVAADRAPLSARRSSTLFACLHLRRCRYPSGYLPYVLIRNEHTFTIQYKCFGQLAARWAMPS